MTSKPTPGPWVAIYPEQRRHIRGTEVTSYEVMTDKTRGELRDIGHTHYRRDPGYGDNIEIAVGGPANQDMELGEMQANADLIAAAGTAASEVAEMGYDPVKAVKALPQVLRRLEQISDFYETGEPIAWNFGRRLQESGIMDDVATILAQAAGNGGDDD